MYRSMMQVFVKGSETALPFYQKAFDAKLLCRYPENGGPIMHAELEIDGHLLAVSEQMQETSVVGNTMMFCLHFGPGGEEQVRRAHEVLGEDARECSPPELCDYSPLQTVIIDKFGVWWCIFV